VEIRTVDVSGNGRTTRVVVAATADPATEVGRGRDGEWVLTLRGARLPAELERKLDAADLDGPVAWVAAYRAGPDVRVAVALRPGEEATPALSRTKVGPSTGIAWTFASAAPRRVAIAARDREAGAGGFLGEAPAYAMAAAPRAGLQAAPPAPQAPAPGQSLSTLVGGSPAQQPYSGKRVDFTAKGLDIIQFLQAIAEVSKRNIVASDEVGGTVNIRLRNVPWDEALDIVLRTKNLGREEVGDIIRVAPMERLRAEQKAAVDAKLAADQVAQLKVRLIPVNYATAGQMVDRVKDLLTPRGTVSVDPRTNVLIVKDTVEALTRAELLVRNLDTQTPQVLIEARIVEAQTTWSRAVGIQWGGDAKATPATGNPTGLVFPNLVSMAGAADDGSAPTSATSPKPNFAVNMPTSVGAGTGGGVGFIFGSAGGAASLNLRLSAAEVNGTIKTISAPKVTTLDNESATISQGVSVPFSQTSASGASTSFMEARLSLQVTPHVTSDGGVLLRISASNNSPNTQLTGSNGQPSISRREASTNVMVRDGDTTVIGGIYTRRSSLQEDGVPYLSRLPIIGRLFHKNNELDDRSELLIFITPRIVNRQQSLVTTGDAP